MNALTAARELRRCVRDLGFKGLRVVPWLWEAPPTDRRYHPLYAACVDLGVPFCTHRRGLRGLLETWMAETEDPLLRGPVQRPSGVEVNDPDGLSADEPTIYVP